MSSTSKAQARSIPMDGGAAVGRRARPQVVRGRSGSAAVDVIVPRRAGRARRAHRPVGVGEEHAAEPRRRARPPGRRARSRSAAQRRRRARATRREYRAADVGFVFQSHNLLPTLTAAENVQVPMFGRAARGASARRARARAARRGRARRTGRTRGRRCSRAASASGSRSPARSRTSRACCSPTSRPARSTRRRASRSLELLERLRAERGTTILLVTNDDDGRRARRPRPAAPRRRTSFVPERLDRREPDRAPVG